MKRSLKTYLDKRNFAETSEPKGASAPTGRIFVVQKHHATRLHYDFRLEHHGALLSWAVPKEPSLDTKVKRLAVRVEDHPVDYADFAGVIPKGNYGAGLVEIWDRGTWQPRGDVDEGLEAGKLEFSVDSEKLSGPWVLVRMNREGTKENWLLIRENEAPEQTGLPALQLCTLRKHPPTGPGWQHEIKWDGYRVLATGHTGVSRIWSRNGNELLLSALTRTLSKIEGDFILDGELVVLESNGRSSMDLLKKSLKSNSANVRFAVFDLLRDRGEDLRHRPLEERRRRLEKFLETVKGPIFLSPLIEGEGVEVYASACRLNLEGIVSKKIDSPYSGNRSPDWIKVKCRQSETGTIVGMTRLNGTEESVGALLIAQRQGSKWIYRGRVGTGFSSVQRTMLYRDLLKDRARDRSVQDIEPLEARGAIWIAPKHQVRYEFLELTDRGRLRQASYLGPDKQPQSESKAMATRKTAQATTLTHPDRIIDPQTKTTKQDVYDYYQAISEWLFLHLRNRLVTLLRCPDGLEGSRFYQKHLMKGKFEGFESVTVETKEGKEEFMMFKSAIAILESCQMGAIEFHPWGSIAKSQEKPDRLIFDLDPSESIDWGQLVDAAFIVKKGLESIGLVPFVKVTGGKGIHVVCSIKPEFEWTEVKALARTMAEQWAKEHPKLFLTVAGKADRKDKIYLDYLRNAEGATAIAPYSLRAHPGLPVSMPLKWEELSALKGPTQWTIENAQAWIEARSVDPWEEFSSSEKSLKQILKI